MKLINFQTQDAKSRITIGNLERNCKLHLALEGKNVQVYIDDIEEKKRNIMIFTLRSLTVEMTAL